MAREQSLEAMMSKSPRIILDTFALVSFATLLGACTPGIDPAGQTPPGTPSQALPVSAAMTSETAQASGVGSSVASQSTIDTEGERAESGTTVPPNLATGNPFIPVTGDAEPIDSVDAVAPLEHEAIANAVTDHVHPDESQAAEQYPMDAVVELPVVDLDSQTPDCEPGFIWVEKSV